MTPTLSKPHDGSPPERPSRWLRVLVHTLCAITLAFLLACGGVEPGPEGGAVQGIVISGNDAKALTPHTQGEEVVIPLEIHQVGDDVPGTRIVVTPTVKDATSGGVFPGIFFDPASVTVTVPTSPAVATLSFRVVIGDGAQRGDAKLIFTREGTPGTAKGLLTTSTILPVRTGLVRVEVSPLTADIPLGSGHDFTYKIWPRGHTNQVSLTMPSAHIPYITFAPQPVVVTLVPGAVDPVERTVRIVANASAQLGAAHYIIKTEFDDMVGEGEFRVVDQSTGDPTFTITANPLEVTVANGVSSENVYFTVNSVNGFNGRVKITWVVDGGVSPQPNDNDFEVDVAPGAPASFIRKMYRYTTGTEEIPITFNATRTPGTTQKSVTINVKHP